MLEPEVWAFIGIVLGISARIIIPYFYKLQEDPTLSFCWRYVGLSVFTVIILSILILPNFTIPAIAPWKIVPIAASFGWASNDLINYFVKGVSNSDIKIADKETKIENKIAKLESKLSNELKKLEETKTE